MKVKLLRHVRLFATPWTVACQAPQSMEFSRQEYWSGLPFPSPRDLLNPGVGPGSPALQADTLPSEPPGKPCSQRREWQSTPVFLPGELHGQRSLVSYHLWGYRESDTTERLTHIHTPLLSLHPTDFVKLYFHLVQNISGFFREILWCVI